MNRWHTTKQPSRLGPLASSRPKSKVGVSPLARPSRSPKQSLMKMDRDEKVFVLGEDVGPFGGAQGHLKGLYERFGDDRVIDTPISEAGFIGAASGAAVEGFRPVVELMIVDFFGVAMDQIANYMPKVRYASAGGRNVPLTLLASVGNPLRQGINHSQMLYGLFGHLPGLKTVAPSTAYDAKGLLTSAIRDDDPVLFLFHRTLNPVAQLPPTKGRAEAVELPTDPYEIPLGSAEVKRAGSDVTIVTLCLMVHRAIHAANDLEATDGIDAEVIDLRSVMPWDKDLVMSSVEKTGRLLIVDEDYRSFGLSGEVIASVAEANFGALKTAPRRLTRPDTPIPYSRSLEDRMVPDSKRIADEVRELMSAV